ncbi:MAG: hypothetical protein ACREHG_09975 [Candidatus Saccharimonadales bacterium]
MELQELMDLLERTWKFDAKNYPKLKGKSEEEVLLFALAHGMRHLHKSLDRLETMLEADDHGVGTIDYAAVCVALVKIINTDLRLLRLFGHSGQRVIASCVRELTH